MIEHSDLLGSWTLIRHGFQRTDGNFIPTAPVMSGQLIYAQDGSMSVLITKKPQPIEMSDLIAYSGYFLLEEGIIYHCIEVSPDPVRVGRKEQRVPKLDHNMLTLRTMPSQDGYYEIVWQRKLFT